MPTDLGLKAMNAVHRGMLKLSGGHVGWHAMNMPVLELTTTGRKSGLARSVMLTSPMQDGTTLVVASRGGDDRPPAWLLNVQENPEVDVVLQGAPATRMYARVATPEERARLWPLVVADHTNYADYQKRTSREIALVLLEPVA
jgi:deazaflavin-dependent oxidoreductase (nitroreductase family)